MKTAMPARSNPRLNLDQRRLTMLIWFLVLLAIVALTWMYGASLMRASGLKIA